MNYFLPSIPVASFFIFQVQGVPTSSSQDYNANLDLLGHL